MRESMGVRKVLPPTEAHFPPVSTALDRDAPAIIIALFTNSTQMGMINGSQGSDGEVPEDAFRSCDGASA